MAPPLQAELPAPTAGVGGPAPGDPLHSLAAMTDLVAHATGRSAAEVAAALRAEHRRPGSTVAAALARAGVRPHVWSAEMGAFYASTDAFIFELALWNIHPIKRALRARVAAHLRRWGRSLARGPTLDVLCIGDGLGFDARRLAEDGHRVTYREFPGPSERFARALLARRGVGAPGSVTISADPEAVTPDAFDAVVCLDVLEHVPDVPSTLRAVAAQLRPPGLDPDGRRRPGGRLLVSAPFALIHPAYGTHLRASRRYSGSLSVYTRAGLRPVRAWPFWDPIVLERREGLSPAELTARGVALPWGMLLHLGRLSGLPFYWQHTLRRLTGRWFNHG